MTYFNPSDERWRTAVGEKVCQRRETLGWTQKDLAKAAKTSRDTIKRIETGVAMPNILTVCAIAEALKVKVSDLIN